MGGQLAAHSVSKPAGAKRKRRSRRRTPWQALLWIAPAFLITLMSLPAGSVPAGFSRDNLPIGLQVVAPRFDEPRILAECERRECAVIVLFRDALERDLSQNVRGIVTREFETLLASIGSLATARERAERQRRLVVGEPI